MCQIGIINKKDTFLSAEAMLHPTALRQHHNAVEKQEAVNNLLPTSAEDTSIPYFIC